MFFCKLFIIVSFPHISLFLVSLWCWCCIFHDMFPLVSAFHIKPFPPLLDKTTLLDLSIPYRSHPLLQIPTRVFLPWAPDARTWQCTPSISTYSCRSVGAGNKCEEALRVETPFAEILATPLLSGSFCGLPVKGPVSLYPLQASKSIPRGGGSSRKVTGTSILSKIPCSHGQGILSVYAYVKLPIVNTVVDRFSISCRISM